MTAAKTTGTLSIRAAVPGDAAFIYAMVLEFAAYERLSHWVDATQEGIASALFGERPLVFCEIAEWAVAGEAPEPVATAVWFYNFSTFRGRHGLYLEDLFVRPAHRRRGVGAALLAHLARRCIAEKLGRFEWTVLGWNASAIEFYRVQGAQLLDDWKTCRVSDEALARMAKGAA